MVLLYAYVVLQNFSDEPYFNNTFAKPFNWTFTGRPISTKRDSRPKTWKEKWVAKQQFRMTSPSIAH